MGFERFEKKIEGAVDDAFAKLMPSDLQPLDITEKLKGVVARRATIVSRERTLAPNVYHVRISTEDMERMRPSLQIHAEDFVAAIRDFGQAQGYTFPGPVEVVIHEDATVTRGTSRVEVETVSGVEVKPHSGSTVAERISLVDSSGTEIPITRPVTRLGRGADVDVRIDEPSVSRSHAQILVGADIVIRDDGSSNGTFVDGVQVRECALRDGSVIRLGLVSFTLRRG